MPPSRKGCAPRAPSRSPPGIGTALARSCFEGGVYLRPTIVLCDSFAHPLANREFLFPYASVVQVPQAEHAAADRPLPGGHRHHPGPGVPRALLDSPLIDRLNLGPISTMQVSWDQPHEGNLFEFLYRRRSIEWDGEASAP